MSLDAMEIIKQKHDKIYKDLKEQSAEKYGNQMTTAVSKLPKLLTILYSLKLWVYTYRKKTLSVPKFEYLEDLKDKQLSNVNAALL